MDKLNAEFVRRPREHARAADSIGDMVGPNDTALANLLWASAAACARVADEWEHLH